MKPEPLLSRDAFREGVFARDGRRCVMCGDPAKDAHHIMERRLFADGGYYLSNGASVCEPCHLRCEATLISVDDVRAACGITKPIIPEHLYHDVVYDKWGNIILPNGERLRGELFYDSSVQKVLEPVLHLFTDKVKYPRTHHVPWSEGITDDDRVLSDLSRFAGQRVIVTEKMDGENTTMYRGYIHARSLDSRHHPSRDWVKNFWGTICGDIPEGWRVCGENLYAQHSIAYTALSTYFMGFSIWDERNECLSWDDTLDWFRLLGVTPVPVLYDGIYDERVIRALYDAKRDWSSREGYVLRVADRFSYGQFRHVVGKFVRKDHVRTVKHWMYGQPIVRNTMV